MGAVSDRGIRVSDSLFDGSGVGHPRLDVPDADRPGRRVRSGMLACLLQTFFSDQAGGEKAGIRSLKAVPSSSDEVTPIVPPWAATISRAMKRPSPRLASPTVGAPAPSTGTCTSGSKMT